MSNVKFEVGSTKVRRYKQIDWINKMVFENPFCEIDLTLINLSIWGINFLIEFVEFYFDNSKGLVSLVQQKQIA